MLGVGGLLPPPLRNSNVILTTTPHSFVSFSLLVPYRTPHQIIVSPFLNASSFSPICTGRRELRAFALGKRREKNGNIMGMEGSDSDDAEEEDSDGEDDDEEDFPLEYMRQWTENKPPGFGEGKVYDTSIEDKMLEELEQSRQAQVMNINKLKNNRSRSQSNKGQLQFQKAPELFPSGACVRVFNLPKKRNIHRDLQSVLKDFSGLINIRPAISGNKKTRDPICRGFAFIDLKSTEDANRFIQKFSKQSIMFGKIQKQIKCEMMNPPTLNLASEVLVNGTNSPAELAITSGVGVVDKDVNLNLGNVAMNSSEEVKSGESHGLDDSLESAEFQENVEPVHVLKINDGDGVKQNTDFTAVSSSSKQPDKPRAIKKKKVVKRKVGKVPKLNIPGSALRLKVKDKAVLTDVLSKYGMNNAAST